MSDVDIQTVTLMTTYRVGFLPPEMGSLAAGEFYVELPPPDTPGVPRVWVGVPAYGGVSGDTALLIPPPPSSVAAITVDPVSNPSPSDAVEVLGTVTPGTIVEVVVTKGADHVTSWMPVDASDGVFELSLTMPEGDGYIVHVRERAAPENCEDAGPFTVGPPVPGG